MIQIGDKVYKVSGKPFKSRNKVNTVKEFTTNKYTNKPACTFFEDDSAVDLFILREKMEKNMTLKSNIKARNYREICKELDGFEFRPVRLSSMIILRILFTSIEKAKLAENIFKEKQVQFCPVRFDDGHKQFHYIELFITGSAAFGIFDSGKYYSVSETTEIHKQEKKRKSDKAYKPYDNDYLGF